MAAYLPNQDYRLYEVEDAGPTSANRIRQPRHQQPRASRHERRPEERSRSSQHRVQGEEHRERPSFWQRACGLCQEDHPLNSCRRFLELSPYQRYETIERRSYCRNCLARSHLAPDCPSLHTCRHCDYRHHTLIHGAPQLNNSLQPPSPSPVLRWNLVFVPTAMVQVVGEEADSPSIVRALIQQGASMSRISYSSFQRMGLRSFIFLGHRFTSFKIKARNQASNWALKVYALITDELPYRPYCDPIIEDPTKDFSGGSLADVDPRSNTPIELELGADVYSAIVQEGKTFSGVGAVYGFQTALGYLLAGPIRNLPINSPY
ncbi:uncharacterized protein [Musca autumnalis]|uniref:uncharacterized protein n=1 Tax=Musca autumnalis TaxID=221902 RepID=UPI003CEBA3CB